MECLTNGGFLFILAVMLGIGLLDATWMVKGYRLIRKSESLMCEMERAHEPVKELHAGCKTLIQQYMDNPNDAVNILVCELAEIVMRYEKKVYPI